MALKSSAVNSGLYSNDQPLSLFKASGSVILSSFDFITSSTFSAVSSVSIDNCFSADYDHYLIMRNIYGSSSGARIDVRLRSSGSDSTTNYRSQALQSDNNSRTGDRTISLTLWYRALGTIETGSFGFSKTIMSNPFNSVITTGLCDQSLVATGNILLDTRVLENDAAQSFDGFTAFTSTGTMTGTIYIYGWKI